MNGFLTHPGRIACLAACLVSASLATGQTDDAADQLALAVRSYGSAQWDSAMIHIQRAITADPEMAEAYKLRGDIHQQQHNYKAALMDYNSSEKLDRGSARLYVSRSALHITEGRVKAGMRDADRALDLDPKDADAWYNRAWALYQGDDFDAALKSVRMALELNPAFPQALYLSGVVKGARYDEKEGAQEISEALKLDPMIPGGLMSLAVVLYEGKQYEEAIPKFTEVIATDTTELASAFYYRADCHYMLGDKDKACLDWQRSMRLGDKDAAFIKRNYCDTDATKIPRKPKNKRRVTTIHF